MLYIFLTSLLSRTRLYTPPHASTRLCTPPYTYTCRYTSRFVHAQTRPYWPICIPCFIIIHAQTHLSYRDVIAPGHAKHIYSTLYLFSTYLLIIIHLFAISAPNAVASIRLLTMIRPLTCRQPREWPRIDAPASCSTTKRVYPATIPLTRRLSQGRFYAPPPHMELFRQTIFGLILVHISLPTTCMTHPHRSH